MQVTLDAPNQQASEPASEPGRLRPASDTKDISRFHSLAALLPAANAQAPFWQTDGDFQTTTVACCRTSQETCAWLGIIGYLAQGVKFAATHQP